ncbi:MAG: hypothetical protein ACXWVT_10660 [Burkholderiaceae bacterium]
MSGPRPLPSPSPRRRRRFQAPHLVRGFFSGTRFAAGLFSAEMTMQTILAGRIDTHERAQDLMAKLRERGVALSDMQTYYLTPPGQHGQFPIGGDQYSDPDAKDASKTQAAGAAVGAVAGLVAGGVIAAIVPPLAPVIIAGVTGVGALGGSVAGAVSGTKSAEESEQGHSSESRQGGLMVAVRVTPTTEHAVRETLESAGASDIERATGEWRDGHWVDLNSSGAQPQRIEEP